MNMDDYGFVVLRNVTNEKTNEYWNRCVRRLNYFYPLRTIIIIDDNSKKEFIKELYPHKNITIYESEYPTRGELLPFLYFLKHHWFEKMIFIHDSCFFHKRISFDKLPYYILPLWHFDADNEQNTNILYHLQNIKHSQELISFFQKKDLFLYNSREWYGIFGLMCMIDYEILNQIHQKYNLLSFTKIINSRNQRCGLERSLSIIFYKEYPQLKKVPSLLGNIFQYGIWNLSYEEYLQKKYNLPLVKVWTGR